jgi:asparagine synthase (glutamine-hydrolysing)
MCGFAVMVCHGRDINPELLADMRDALAHRGPDAAASWIKKGVGLGFRRLSIIDLTERADQPMTTADGRYVIVFNGEIYNYLELRDELRAEGAVFRTESDTEVLLAALERWKDAALTRLNGMFAFALWDCATQELLVARDRFGEKPLFMTALPDGGIALAFEMKALLRNPDVSDATDLEILGAYTQGRYFESGRDTLFKAIKRVPAATAIRFDRSGKEIRRWRYWTPDYTAVDARIDEPTAIQRFHDLLQRSVRMRLRADVPVGSSLSGGLDSSLIVGMMAQERDGRNFEQNTFSARFHDDPILSEGEYIDIVAQATRVNVHSVEPDPQQLIEESQRLHWYQEEPFLSASIYLQWCVARLAKQNDTTVLLDGQGADELLGGYQFYYRPYQLDLLDKGLDAKLESETQLFNSRLQHAANRFGADSARRFNAKVAYPLQDLDGLAPLTNLMGPTPYPEGVPASGPGLRIRQILAEALQWNSLPSLLRYADRNAMAHSREPRLPYLDYDLVDFCIGLPEQMLFSRGWQKYVQRMAARNYVPHEVRWRADKVGYAAPLDVWMRGPLKEWCNDRVFGGAITNLPGYDRTALTRLWDAHQSADANNSWALWRWISLNEWMDLGRNAGWRRSQ